MPLEPILGRRFRLGFCRGCFGLLLGHLRSFAVFLVELEGLTVVHTQRCILVLFAQDAIADDEHFDVGAHKAAKGVLRCADNRLAAHVEARIDQHRAARLLLEAAQQSMEARIGLSMHGLQPR